MKRQIRLTESDLRDIVKESVRRVLREGDFGGIDTSKFGSMDAKEALAKVKEIEAYLRSISDMNDYEVGDGPNTKFSAKAGGPLERGLRDKFGV